jgi:hypothetical protein
MANEKEQNIALTHEETFELLSWYVNESLSETETAKVKTHVAVCVECQQEIEMLNELKSAVLFSNESLPEPSSHVLDSVMNRIEEYEVAHTEKKPSENFLSRLQSFFSETFGAWNTSSKLVFAGQFAILLLLIGAFIFAMQRSRGFENLAAKEKSRADQNEKQLEDMKKQYIVLTGSNSVDLTNAVRINIAFQERATEKEIRELLGGINATIISGPSENFYVIALFVAKGTDKQKVLNEALEKLKANSKVVLFVGERTE